MENDLTPDALVAGFTNKSLHTEITSFIIFLSGVGNSDFNYDVVKCLELSCELRALTKRDSIFAYAAKLGSIKTLLNSIDH